MLGDSDPKLFLNVRFEWIPRFDQNVKTEVKFTPFEEQRSLDIFLDDFGHCFHLFQHTIHTRSDDRIQRSSEIR